MKQISPKEQAFYRLLYPLSCAFGGLAGIVAAIGLVLHAVEKKAIAWGFWYAAGAIFAAMLLCMGTDFVRFVILGRGEL